MTDDIQTYWQNLREMEDEVNAHSNIKSWSRKYRQVSIWPGETSIFACLAEQATPPYNPCDDLQPPSETYIEVSSSDPLDVDILKSVIDELEETDVLKRSNTLVQKQQSSIV